MQSHVYWWKECTCVINFRCKPVMAVGPWSNPLFSEMLCLLKKYSNALNFERHRSSNQTDSFGSSPSFTLPNLNISIFVSSFISLQKLDVKYYYYAFIMSFLYTIYTLYIQLYIYTVQYIYVCIYVYPWYYVDLTSVLSDISERLSRVIPKAAFKVEVLMHEIVMVFHQNKCFSLQTFKRVVFAFR